MCITQDNRHKKHPANQRPIRMSQKKKTLDIVLLCGLSENIFFS